MLLFKPKVEFVKPKSIFEDIEKAARTCYKSEDKIQYDYDGNSITAEKFVNNIVNVRKHGSVGEHGTIYLKYKYNWNGDWAFYNPYSKTKRGDDGYLYVTTNYRVLQENNLLDHIEKFGCNYIKGLHSKRWTFRFFTQIAMSREANRHRKNSMAEQSTRYCNYSKDKFGNELSISLPDFVNNDNIIELYNNCDQASKTKWMRDLCLDIGNDNDKNEFSAITYWLFANMVCEYCYMKMIELGIAPENARTVLPLDTQTELVHTAYVSDWIHFLKLRLAKNAHPDMRHIAYMMLNELLNNDEIDYEDIENVFNINKEEYEIFLLLNK